MGRRLRLAVFICAAVAGASMWFYVDRILVPYQRADAAAHQRPRGNLSDLYPRWVGARELLLHRRNPYGEDVTREIQKGYYGRVLDPKLPDDPKDREGFAYPVYVVFLLAPTIGVPFPLLRTAFGWFLVLWTATSVGLWLRVTAWRPPWLVIATCVFLTLGSFCAVQGIKLQQLSLLVAGLLAASAAAAASGSLFVAGVLLALSTIKPQLAWPLVAWLLLWTASDWRKRKRLIFGFALAMAVLLSGAEIVLPGWWGMFAGAIAQYRQYTQSQSVIEVILNQVFGPGASGMSSRVSAQFIVVLAVLACGWKLWKIRSSQPNTKEFGSATALVLALAILVAPMYAPYNQVLLLPAILVLVRNWLEVKSPGPSRHLGYLALMLAGVWQWIASLTLTTVYLLGYSGWALDRWKWPFFATFALPVLVFILILVEVQPRREQRGIIAR